MKKESLESIAEYLKGLDLCMLTTISEGGQHASRPMSNNGDVAYDGTSYFFTYDSSSKVKEINKNNLVSLQYVNLKTLGKNTFVNVSGRAEIIKDKEVLKKHWVPSLKVWFPDGLETKGITLLAVKANYVHYWSGMDEGEYRD